MSHSNPVVNCLVHATGFGRHEMLTGKSPRFDVPVVGFNQQHEGKTWRAVGCSCQVGLCLLYVGFSGPATHTHNQDTAGQGRGSV